MFPSLSAAVNLAQWVASGGAALWLAFHVGPFLWRRRTRARRILAVLVAAGGCRWQRHRSDRPASGDGRRLLGVPVTYPAPPLGQLALIVVTVAATAVVTTLVTAPPERDEKPAPRTVTAAAAPQLAHRGHAVSGQEAAPARDYGRDAVDPRVAYYRDVAYCPHPPGMAQACRGVRDHDEELIPGRRWIEMGPGTPEDERTLVLADHMAAQLEFYYSEEYAELAPEDDRGFVERAVGGVVTAFKWLAALIAKAVG